MTRVLLLAVASALSACSAAGNRPEVSLGIVLTPSPELDSSIREAASRWAAASGITVEIGPGGAPVYTDRGLDACGATRHTRHEDGTFRSIDSIAINVGDHRCGSTLHTAMHELGHVLCDLAPVTSECHSAVGTLMQRASNDVERIDEPSLTIVCSVAPCTAFIPE